MPFVLYFRLAVAAHRAFIIFTQGIVLLPFPQLLPEPKNSPLLKFHPKISFHFREIDVDSIPDFWTKKQCPFIPPFFLTGIPFPSVSLFF